MKTKHLLCVTASTLIALGGIAYFGLRKEPSKTIETFADPQVFTLNSENTPSITDGVGSLVVETYSTFNYTEASNESGFHVVLGEGGTMRKAEATKGMSAVTITFSGELKFEANFVDSFSGDHYVIYPVSGEAFTLEGNFWKITALSTSKITSLSITYDCVNAVETPDKSSSSIDGIADKNDFAKLDKIGDDIFFSFEGSMNGYIDASDLTLRDNRYEGKFQYIIDGDHVEYLSPTTFRAFFKLSEWFSNRGRNINLYAHVYVRGTAWDNYEGNLAIWRDHAAEDDSATVITADNKTVGSKTISLSANTWTTEWRAYQAKISFVNDSPDPFGIDEGCKSGGSLFENTSVDYDLFGVDANLKIRYISKDKSPVPATDMFVLSELSENYAIVASSVTYSDYDSTHYYIDVTFDCTLFTKYYSGSELNIWCHLSINGLSWDGANGDLKTANTVLSTDGNWAHQKWMKTNRNHPSGNVGYNAWNSQSMLIIQLKPED